jgi:hypothetical protein
MQNDSAPRMAAWKNNLKTIKELFRPEYHRHGEISTRKGDMPICRDRTKVKQKTSTVNVHVFQFNRPYAETCPMT